MTTYQPVQVFRTSKFLTLASIGLARSPYLIDHHDQITSEREKGSMTQFYQGLVPPRMRRDMNLSEMISFSVNMVSLHWGEHNTYPQMITTADHPGLVGLDDDTIRAFQPLAR